MKSPTHELGLKVRRELVGDAFIANAAKNTDSFNQPFQDLVAEYCFGSVWARDGIPRKTRSLVNIGMLIALNRPMELEAHIRIALTSNGCTKEEVQEVLLQAAVYCGIPAGGEAFRIAKKVIAEMT